MRSLSLFAFLALLASLAGPAWAFAPLEEEERAPLFDTSSFRPQIVFHELALLTSAQFVTISGVVFSGSPVNRVMIGERIARLRPAEPNDLIKLQLVPRGARDAPYRVFFEVPDAQLDKVGANDISVRAMSTDERLSDRHLLTIIRAPTLPAAAGSQMEGAPQP